MSSVAPSLLLRSLIFVIRLTELAIRYPFLLRRKLSHVMPHRYHRLEPLVVGNLRNWNLYERIVFIFTILFAV